jgi:hypothetical protein
MKVQDVARSKQVCIEWMEATVLSPIVSMGNEWPKYTTPF